MEVMADNATGNAETAAVQGTGNASGNVPPAATTQGETTGDRSQGESAGTPSSKNEGASASSDVEAAQGSSRGGLGQAAAGSEGRGPEEGATSRHTVETDVDEMIGVVSQKAAELSKNVATLATSASQEAAVAVQNISETVSGFGSGFVSLFSVFDSPSPADASGSSTAQGRGQTAGSRPAEAEPKRRVASRAMDLQANFGLPPEESLLEAFPCKLIQTYTCWHNAFTPDIPKAFSGTLYITEKNLCFLIDQNERLIPIRLRVEDLIGVSREQPRGPKKGEPHSGSSNSGMQDQLKIKIRAGVDTSGSGSEPRPDLERQWMLLGNFATIEDLESALALMEHLTGAE